MSGIVAVSSVGCTRDPRARELFLQGYAEMIKRLKPVQVIFYGHVFEECGQDVIRVKPFGEKFTARGKEAARREMLRTQIYFPEVINVREQGTVEEETGEETQPS